MAVSACLVNRRLIFYLLLSLLIHQRHEVALEAQQAGEIKAWINVSSFVEFIENAGKGAMMSMKESQSLEPVENVVEMMKTFLEK